MHQKNSTFYEDKIKYIRSIYDELDKSLGVNTKDIIILISERMSKKLGCFQVEKKLFTEKKIIKISSGILNNKALFEDCIRHEYAHAVVYLLHPFERHNHDAVWKELCKKIGCAPKASVNLAQSINERPYKYEVVCNKCGAVSKYKNKSNVVKILLGEMRGTVRCKACLSSEFTVRESVNEK